MNLFRGNYFLPLCLFFMGQLLTGRFDVISPTNGTNAEMNTTTQTSYNSSSNNKTIEKTQHKQKIELMIKFLRASGRCDFVKRINKDEYIVRNNSAVIIKKDSKIIHEDFFVETGIGANQSRELIMCLKRIQVELDSCTLEPPKDVAQNVSDISFKRLNDSNLFHRANRSMESRLRKRKRRADTLCASIDNAIKAVNKDDGNSDKDDFILSTLTFVLMIVSIAAMVYLLVTYALFSELRSLPGKNLMNLTASILLSQLVWISGTKRTANQTACTAIAITLHYLFLASFAWTAIIAFDTWKAFSSKVRNVRAKHIAYRYMAIGWLPILGYVLICVGLDQSEIVSVGYGSRDACWIQSVKSLMYFFAIPAGVLTSFNIVLFSMTVKGIRNSRKQARPAAADHSDCTIHLGTYIRIASLMGFTWIFGFAASFSLVYLSYVFVVLHSLQGVYIAASFGLCQRVRKLYKKSIRGKFNHEPTMSGTTGRSGSTTL